MARTRAEKEDNKLPDRVYKGKYSFYLKTKDNKTISLCPLDTPMHELWIKYDEQVGHVEHNKTFKALWDLYINSPAFFDSALRTQQDKIKSGKNLLKVFANMDSNKIKPEHVRRYLDIRGLKSKTQANHELAYMSVAFSWGAERGYCLDNPCKNVKKFSIKSRDKYITDKEYYLIYANASDLLKVSMEISYLCASRVGDVLDIKWDKISKKGIFIQQGKTGVKQIKKWSFRLKRAVVLARKLSPPTSSESYLLSSRSGVAVTHKTINTHWNKAKKLAEDIANYEFGCNFHDIKAKAISDFEGSTRDKQAFSGHKTEAQVNVYNRKVQETATLKVKMKKYS